MRADMHAHVPLSDDGNHPAQKVTVHLGPSCRSLSAW